MMAERDRHARIGASRKPMRRYFSTWVLVILFGVLVFEWLRGDAVSNAVTESSSVAPDASQLAGANLVDSSVAPGAQEDRESIAPDASASDVDETPADPDLAHLIVQLVGKGNGARLANVRVS